MLNRRHFIAAMVASFATPAFALPTADPVETRIRRLSPVLDGIIRADAPIETIATGIKWAEGPVWVERGNYLLFSDPPANIMRRWSRRSGTSIFLQPSGMGGADPRVAREPGSNGLAIDHQGRLVIADSGSRALVRLDLATRKRTMLVGRYKGKRFNSPNDLHIARSGAIYFTDPPYGLVDSDTSPLKELPHNGVYRWVEGREPVLLDGELTRPNGIALSPDEKRLYVSVSDEIMPRIMVYDLDTHGMPTARRTWLDARDMMARGGKGLPDGMKIAPGGMLFCTAPGGLWIMDPDGTPVGQIDHGQAVANCAFGEGGRSLFLTATDRVLRVPLQPGALAHR